MPAKTVKRESPYLRVGTTIYKRVRQPLSSGRSVETLIPWNVETLRQDYAASLISAQRQRGARHHQDGQQCITIHQSGAQG